MTGEDHHTDALIAALTSPPLPSEQVGQDAAVEAMLDALSAVPARPTGHRPRRGVLITAVTVASLGVGGLVAAGPGHFFSPAADRPPATGPTSTAGESFIDSADDDDGTTTTMPDPDTVTSSLVARIADPGNDLVRDEGVIDDPADECEADRHGDAVSDIARSGAGGEAVSDVARSDCGTPEQPDTEGGVPAVTAPGRTGDTPAVTAPAARPEPGPPAAPPGQTGDTPDVTAPGRSGGNGRP